MSEGTDESVGTETVDTGAAVNSEENTLSQLEALLSDDGSNAEGTEDETTGTPDATDTSDDNPPRRKNHQQAQPR